MATNESDVQVTPIHQTPVPVGTLAELEEQGLDPTVYASCSRPNPVTQVQGCPYFGKCRVSARGVSGPRNYGIRVIKGRAQGGGMVNTMVDCMWLADHVHDIEANGGSVKVIAEEGQEFEKVTRIAVSNQTGEVEKNKWNKDVHREDRRIKVLVKPWPRPNENRELLQDVLRAEVSQEERERRSDEGYARNLGLEGTIAPLDKRGGTGGGRAEGRAKEGGGKSGT